MLGSTFSSSLASCFTAMFYMRLSISVSLPMSPFACRFGPLHCWWPFRVYPGHWSFSPLKFIALLHNTRNGVGCRQVLFSSLAISHSSSACLSMCRCTQSLGVSPTSHSHEITPVKRLRVPHGETSGLRSLLTSVCRKAFRPGSVMYSLCLTSYFLSFGVFIIFEHSSRHFTAPFLAPAPR